MSGQRAYLDCNATTPLRPLAREAMLAALGQTGNASSVHGEGRNARRIIEQARVQVAASVHATQGDVIFTASATEAAHLALSPRLDRQRNSETAGRLYLLETEHPCILAGGRFAPERTVAIPVGPDGVIDEAAFDALLGEHEAADGPPFVAIQLANSETGVIQPVAAIARKVRSRGGYVLCDAVQALGRIDVDIRALDVDLLLLSAHKIGGPQGAAALVVADEALRIDPAIRGGGQERNRRAGTENVAAIAGFGVAAEVAAAESDDFSRITALRDSLEAAMHPICTALGVADRFVVAGSSAPRIGNTTLFCLEGLDAQTALISFDLEGVAVSSGSACSSGKIGNSHVLAAMGMEPARANGAIRVSLGWNSVQHDCDRFLAAFERIAAGLAKRIAGKAEVTKSGAA